MVLCQVKQLRAEMVREGIRPNLHQYTALVKGLEDAGMHAQAWEVFQECKVRDRSGSHFPVWRSGWLGSRSFALRGRH